MEISKFSEKLNKLDGQIYSIEEIVNPVNGLYEGDLEHDNVNLATLNIYTGSKLTGDKINAYTTSTPSLTPWKTTIKIYSDVSPLYISYETDGDKIEAGDINDLQEAVVATQNNLNNVNDGLETYKTQNELNLNNRYTKDQVFTKDEILQKINDLIGIAPELLNTFAEVANALGNDPNFATTILTLLSQKADSSNVYSKSEVDNKLVGVGTIDMIKSIYDTDNDGVVDKAKSVVGPVNWNNLKGV